ncbi:MAG TPA: hypothetical protein VK090_05555, partial [Paracoccaceae bacterium]|nr:hypothetical protein [Paracoccaceae bacterium]
ATDYHSPQIAERFRWVVHGNRCGDLAVRLHQAGLRKELFGQDPFLSKHALVRNHARVMVQTHPHFATNVNVADVTFLIHHFKFAGDWVARDQVAALEGHWGHGREKGRMAAIGGDAGEFCLTPAEPRAWRGVEVLLEEGFLYASPRFRREMGLSPT